MIGGFGDRTQIIGAVVRSTVAPDINSTSANSSLAHLLSTPLAMTPLAHLDELDIPGDVSCLLLFDKRTRFDYNLPTQSTGWG